MGALTAVARDFARSFAGPVIAPGQPDYDDARRVWNDMFDRHPALIVRPTSVADVQSAVRLGREERWDIAVRGGGHSIAGLSTCDDGLVIDLSLMRGVIVDPGARRARVIGGALLSELDQAAQREGLVCPVGVVGHTGVGGLALGGGLGRLMRRFGLTIDSVVGMELVTADGRVVHASETEEPDLFWGLRGAGANFGIVTRFDFALHPFGPEFVRGYRVFPVSRTQDAWAAFVALAETGSRDLTAVSFGIDAPSAREEDPPAIRDAPTVAVAWAHVGPEDAASRDLADLLALPALHHESARWSYLEVQTSVDEEMRWGQRFYSKGVFGNQLRAEVLDELIAHAAVTSNGSSVGALGLGGAIRDVPDDATAFEGRDAVFWMSADSLWQLPEHDADRRDWARQAIAIVEPDALAGAYVNGVSERGIHPVDVYGDEKHARLRALKRIWDPDNTFRLNHNVAP